MLTALPPEMIDAALRGQMPVYIFAFLDHEWDVFTSHSTNVSRSGIFRCGPAEEISARTYVRIFGISIGGDRTETAYVDVDHVFAVVSDFEDAKALFQRMEEIEAAYQEDIRGPLLKMHTAMAVLQASLGND